MADAGDFRALLGRFPSGVAVVTVDSGGQRLGLTLGTLVGLSLDPPLVAFSVARQAALHELLREAGRCTISLLAAGQEALAEHFARGVPPIGMWEGIAIQSGGDGRRASRARSAGSSASSATRSRPGRTRSSSAPWKAPSTVPTHRRSSASAAASRPPDAGYPRRS